MKKDIDKILNNFKNEIKNDIPSFFQTETEKKAFYNACEKSLFLKNFLDCMPPKMLYYCDFTKYVKYDLKSGYTKEFDCIINGKMEALRTVSYTLGFPIYDFIQRSLDSFDDIHLYNKTNDIDVENDSTDKEIDLNNRKKLIIRSHSPFFLYYIIKYWEYLPLPAKPVCIDSLNKGILHVYRKLEGYYMNAEHKDALTTRYIAESVLSGKYFSEVVNEFFLNPNSKLKTMDKELLNNVINTFVLIRFLPGEELKIIFLQAFKTRILEKYDDKEKLPYEFLEEAKKINKMILSFVEETLMFIVKTKVIFPVYFMRSINKSIEPNLTDNQSKIKEGTIGISIESLYNIREYLADKSVINDEKREVANIIESLEQIYEKKTDFKIDLFYKQYYCSADPLVQIQNMQENLSCTYQTACEEYAKCIIKGIE